MSKLTAIRLVLVVFLLASFLSPAQPVFADKANVCGAPGKDGPATALSGVINSYYPGTGNVAVGALSIPVGAARAGGGPAIAAGDLLLIVQVQGAEINAANTNNYGNGVGNNATTVNTVVYSAANNYAGGHVATNFYAGNYEYVVAAGPVTAGAVPLATPTTIAFYNADFGTQGQRRFQVIRVPQYSSATLGGTLTAPAWDGTTGGFVVLDVAGQLNWNGNAINASGIGFRGGAGRQLGGDTGNWWDFRTLSTDTTNGSKGEGYAGTPRYVFFNNALANTGAEGYPNGSYGRGAAGNGGGGSTDGNPSANDENSGGGGGGNGGAGGMGGNSWDSQTVNGGYGGAPFPGSAPRLILGGGGGAGTTNDGTGTPGAGLASSGAAGGGVVFVRAGTITGNGTINASGANALNTVENDGGGGGGAGGSVVVIARNGGGAVGTLTVNAQGGTGGSTWTAQPRGSGGANRHGPGGGGGGGFVYTSAALAASNLTGGANGVTTTNSEDFGATDGLAGTLVTNATPATIPPAISGAGCTTITPAVTKTTSTPTITQTATGVTGTYTITVSVPASSAWASGVLISDTLPTPPTGTITYAATTNVALTGTGTTRSTTTNPTAGTVTPSWGTFDIAPGGSVAITFTVNFSADVPAGTYQNPAQATYLNPTRTVSTDSIAVTYASGSSTAEDITVTASADLQITKTDGVTNVRTGDTLTYSVVVTNRGPAAANNSVFTDPAVAGLNVTGVTCGSATGGAACPAPAATTVALMRGAGIVIPTLPANGSVTFTITASVTAVSGSLANVANVAPPTGLPDPGVYPNSATDTDTVVSNPQIALAKTPASQMVVSGSNVNFTLTVTNPGDVPLNTVNLTDAQCTTGPTRVSGDTNSNNILETSETWVYSCTINNATADYTNNASVSGVAPSGTTVNAAASATVDVIQPAILLDKTPATQSVVYGSPANFTLTVTNPGDVPLNTVNLTDAQCTTGPTRVSGDTNSNNILETSETWVYSCQIANITANLTNSASVSAAAPAGPAVTSADTANVTMTLSPAITLEKTGTLDLTVVPPAGTANVGDRITYTFTVRNTGNVPLTNITVSDPLITVSGGPLASLAVGASDSTTFTGTYTLTQANINAGSFTNTATASGTPPVGAAVTGADNDTQTLTPAPAISLVKTGTLDLTVVAPAASANVGDVINYAFAVSNTGNVTLTNITLADTVGGVTLSGGPLASLNPGQTDTTTFTGAYTLTQADIDAGSFANTATVTGTPPAGANVSSPDIETVAIPQDARLSITKSATSTGPYAVGNAVTYDIVATNIGTVTLSGVTVTDPGTGAVLGACTPAIPASLTPGASVTCAATHVVSQTDLDTGSYLNTATADSDQTSPVTDDETVTFTQTPALTVTKTATSSGPYTVGSTISYDIVARNTGNITLADVSITDPGVDAVLGACTPAIPATLAPGALVTCAATHVVTQTDIDAGSYLNTATADSDLTTPVTDSETVTFTQTPSLAVTKSVTSSGPYTAGSAITYNIVATNTGNITLSGVTVTDPGTGATLGACTPAIPATLAPTATVTCAATHVVAQADLDAGSYVNTATADSDQTTPVTDGETVTFTQSPVLTVSKSVTSSGPYTVGDTLTYDIIATNAGNVTLSGVTITDPGAGATLGACTPAIPASLAPGASVTCEATHVVTQGNIDAGSYVNIATADSDTTSPVTDAETVTFSQSPALSVIKTITSTGPYAVGDTLSYDIVATNTGNVTLHSVAVTDPSAVVGTCVPALPATLAPAASVTCEATHVVTQTDLDTGSYLNTATADSDETAPATDSETVTFTQNPALAVTKLVTSSGPYTVGDTISYDIVARNTGNITLASVTVTDPGTGAVLGACTPAIPAALAPGASVTCAATHVVTQTDLDAGSYLNTATADSDQTSPVTDDETVTFAQSPALAVTKSVTSSGPYAVGDTLSYDIIATNNGNITLANVTVTDPGTGAVLGACTPAIPATLAPAASVTCAATHVVTQTDIDAGSYLNTATADSDQTSPVSEDETVAFTQSPALAVTKTVTSTGPYVVGDTIRYDIVATNTGNVTLNAVSITDSSATLGTCTPALPASLAPGASVTCEATHLVTQGDIDAGSYVNTATADSDETTPASESETVTFTQSPALVVAKTATSSGPYAVGDTITYDITATNTGNISLTGVTVTDPGTNVTLGACTPAIPATLAPSASVSCAATHTVSQADLDAGSFVNLAAADSDQTAAVTDSETVTFVQSPALAVTKSVTSSGPYAVGDTISYDIVATNTGNITLSGVTVADPGTDITLGGCTPAIPASLAPGAAVTCAATHTVTQANIDAGSFLNVASADSDQTGAVTDDASVAFSQTPSLAVTKSVTSSGPYALGDAVSYNIVATNTGNITLTGVTITDAGTGVTLGACAPAIPASLAPAASVTCAATHTVTQADLDAGSFLNVASADSDQTAAVTDDASVTFTQSPALETTKTATSSGPYAVGDTITYDIVVRNSGNITLSGVTVTDAGFGATLGACTPAIPATLAPNASVTCAATHTVTQADLDAGVYVNFATGDSDQTSIDLDSETVTFTQNPALTVSKSVTTSGPYAVGDTVTYDIVATNAGNITLNNVTVTDPGTGATLGACAPSIPASLAPGASVTCAAAHVVTQADLDAGSYLNTATADSDETAPIGDDETVTFVQGPALTVVKTATSSGPYAVGGTVTYDIVATNTGNITLHNVTVADPGTGAVLGACTPAIPAMLAPNASLTCAATHIVTQADLDAGSYLNTATADSDETTPATDSETVTFVQSPALTVLKSVTSTGPYAVGDTVSYDIVARNTGNTTLANVAVTDPGTGAVLGACTPAVPATLAPNATVTCAATHVVTQTDLDAGSYLNTATADSDQTSPVTDDETVTFTQSPALTVAKTVTSSGPYAVGDTVTYDILATNTGNITLNAVTITDSSAVLGTCTPALPATLAPAASVTCEATHEVTQADLDAGSYVNTATADSDETSPVTDSETVSFTQSPALAVVKSATSSGPYAVGDTISYDIVVTNTGNITLGNVTVSDSSAVLGTCTPALPASLAPGASVTCAATHVVTQIDLDAGSYVNTATADSDQTTPVTDAETVTFVQNPALAVVKTATSTGPYAVGNTVTYDIVATNTGNITLTGVTVTDPGTGATLGACTPAVPASLAPAASVTCAATHIVTQTDLDAGGYLNTATADSDQTSPVTDDETVTFAQSPALALTKSVTSTGPYAVGDTIGYDIIATNTGNITLTSVTITDAGPGVTLAACPTVSLAPGASLSCAATHLVTQTDLDAGSFLNLASADSDQTSPVTDDETVTFTQSPTLALTKSVTSTGPYAVGDTISYDIIATNTGNITLANVTVTDPGTGASLDSCTPAIPASLAPGAAIVCAASHVVTQTDLDAGSYLNTATADSDQTTPVTDTETVTFTQSPALTVVKTATSSGPYAVGDTLTYDITATNTGNVTLSGVSVTDPGTGAVLGACTPAVPASLAPAASVTCAATHVVTQADLDSGSYVNTATADSDQTSPVTDAETVTFTQSPALAVTKSATSTGPYAVGDTISYDILTTNTGNITLHNVNVTDPGTGATLGACAPALPASLAPAASVTCAATHLVTQADLDAGSYLNTATADSDETAPVTDDETVTFVQSPALAVVKTTTSSGPYAVGDTISYDIVARNTGNITLHNVTVTDPGTGAVLGACTPAAPATLAPNASLTCAATHVVTQADLDAGSYLNTAAADSDETTPVSDDETVTFVQSPALAVSKSVTSTGPYAVGDTLTYDIVATNTGNITLANVTVTDPGTGATLGACTPAIPASLAPGASVTCAAAHVVTQADLDTGSYLNTATADSDQTAPVSDDETVTFVQSPAMTVLKSVTSTGPYAVGDTISYDIVATNTGNITLNNVVISDSSAVLGTCTPALPASLAPGASVTCEATHVVTLANINAGSYLNTASADSDQTAPVTDDETVTFTQSPQIALLKTGTLDLTVVAPDTAANVGDVIQYAFTVTNTGNVTLTNITLADTIGGVTISGGPLASLDPGQSDTTTFTGTYTLTLADLNAGTFTNTATVTGTPPTGSPVTGTDDDTQTLAAAAAISLVKTGTLHMDIVAPNSEVNPGDTITYAFTVTNSGNVTLTSITLADTIGGVTISGGPLASLDPGQSDTTTFTGTYTVVQADIDAGTFTNTATVTGTPPSGGPVSGPDEHIQTLPGAPALGVAKRVVGDPVEMTPGVYEVTYEILVRNYGNLPISDLQVTDDLTDTFPAPTLFSVVSLVSPTFTVNPAFNGDTDTDLLSGADSLAVGASGSITLVVQVTPATGGPFGNTATASGETPAALTVTDDSQNGTDPDPDGDGNPGNNNTPTPVSFGPNLFDPPFGVKSVDVRRLPIMRWTVIWINTSNVVAVNAVSSDDIPTGTTFVDDGIPSGYPLPPGAHPTGTTTNGVACVDSSPDTTTTYCYYEGPSVDHPLGRVIWQGTLGPDFGITDPAVADDDIAIRFATRKANGVEAVDNTAVMNSDRNGDGDTDDPGEIRTASASASWRLPVSLPEELPATGFAPGKVTLLPQQPAGLVYQGLEDLKLEIAALKLDTSIVGVPLAKSGWQVSWLGNQVGYLEGTAFPTWSGNSVLTAHVYDANGKPGPFVNLNKLKYGDTIVITAFGQKYVYEVRSVRTQVDPETDVITHEDRPWLTLVTCQGYDEKSDSYRWRTVVRAVLVKVE